MPELPDIELDPGGIEVMGSTIDEFASALTRENHTLKRALADPHLFREIKRSEEVTQ